MSEYIDSNCVDDQTDESDENTEHVSCSVSTDFYT